MSKRSIHQQTEEADSMIYKNAALTSATSRLNALRAGAMTFGAGFPAAAWATTGESSGNQDQHPKHKRGNRNEVDGTKI
jgi:hypothetical protein